MKNKTFHEIVSIILYEEKKKIIQI